MLGGVSPSPFLSRRSLMLRVGDRLGGGARLGMSSLGFLRSESFLEAPLWIWFPLAWGGPVLQCLGSPPMPSLRAVGVRFCVGVPSPPSPPGQTLTSSGTHAALALGGVLSPLSSRVRPALWALSLWLSSPITSLRWLGLSPTPPTPPSCTHGAVT